MDIEDSILNKEHEENMFNKVLDKQRFAYSLQCTFLYSIS